MIGLETFGFALAGRRVPVAEFDAADDPGAELVGVESVLVDDADAHELACRAAQQCLKRDPAGGAGVAAVIVADAREPAALLASDATRVQWELGLSDAVAFSVGGAGCAGSSVAISLAHSLLVGRPDWERVLVVHGSKTLTDQRYRPALTYIGDGGGAVLVGREPRLEILASREETDGRFWDLLSLDYHQPRQLWVERWRDRREFTLTLSTETGRRMRRMVADVLDEAGLTPADVSLCVTQNTSVGAYRFIADITGVPVAPRCEENLRRFGHLGAVDLLLNLSEATERLPAGAAVLAINNSPVAAWCVSVVRVRDDN